MAYYTAVDGVQIYYEEYGKEHEKTLVMVPGHGGSIEVFKRNIPVLAEKYHVVAYDMRGHGRSDRINRHLTIDRCSEDLRGLMQELQLDKPVLLGWSMGSNINLSYVLKYGCTDISGIVVVDNSARMISNEDWEWGAWDSYEGGIAYLESLAKTGWEKYAWDSTPMFFGGGNYTEEDLQWFGTAYADEDLEPMLAIVMTNIFSSYKEALPMIDVPVLFCYGKRPSFYDPKVIFGNASRVRDAAVEGFDGGHAMFFQDADRFNCTLMEFMENGTRNLNTTGHPQE